MVFEAGLLEGLEGFWKGDPVGWFGNADAR